MIRPLLGTLILLCAPLFFFHNCTDVALLPPNYVTMQPSSASGVVLLCTPAQFELSTFFAHNLNGMVRDGAFIPDSDADGIDDRMEVVELGSDPFNRRSRGPLLDSVCYELTGSIDCSRTNLACDPLHENNLTLSECDILALGLDKIFDHPVQGLDSVKDGIPELLEISSSLFANIDDASEDPDHDEMTNTREVEIGSNPRQRDQNLASRFKIAVGLEKLAPDASCPGEIWRVRLDHMPLITTKAFVDPMDNQRDPKAVKLSHEDNENVILLTAKVKPKAGVNLNARILYSSTKMKYIESVEGQALDAQSLGDFQNAGEVRP